MLCLPPEIILPIISSVDARDDVLSLALTCQLMKRFLIPNVLHYREISAPLHATGLWKHLETHPFLARNVRFLRIAHDLTRMPKLDSTIQVARSNPPETGVWVSEEPFLASLKTMTGLATFRWHWRGSCYFIKGGFDKVWEH
ncbi:hypothetical protein JAAARDRAFT_506891 [Jaapia argillacea MUCL 33604]|uniref:F-box domain-containing protein n=1 Tax=Jaapia argillacea MUCL 33604 TaxID=933084 RepID=A0A067Q2Q9_9AGAM|nr:hypothetical protein JAAARDRAFT_506891 [Jaapia argillacea MUCL 33604]